MARRFSGWSSDLAPLARGLLVAALTSLTALTMVARAAENGPHTPEPGSAERRTIAEALHRGGDDRSIVVRQMRVQDGWAWISVDPRPAFGAQPLGTESALLRQIDGRWRVVAQLCTEEGCETASEVRRIRRDNPGSPAAIFPSK